MLDEHVDDVEVGGGLWEDILTTLRLEEVFGRIF